MPTPHRVRGQHRQALDGLSAGADRRFRAVLLQHVHDAPPPGAAAVFEMGVNGRVGLADEALLDLVHGLVLGVAVGYGVFRAFLEIDDKARPRPARRRASPDRVGTRHSRADRGWTSSHDPELLHLFAYQLFDAALQRDEFRPERSRG